MTPVEPPKAQRAVLRRLRSLRHRAVRRSALHANAWRAADVDACIAAGWVEVYPDARSRDLLRLTAAGWAVLAVIPVVEPKAQPYERTPRAEWKRASQEGFVTHADWLLLDGVDGGAPAPARPRYKRPARRP